ncbi:MAG TPA: low specificity L-threonine aldolase [Chthoniobacterales bacterium]|jgi:threonine aldolase|nr:low specificity L-threonine aldolase [Chthoniobacterales bacterium]
MLPAKQRFEFASDNTAAICGPAWEALVSANRDAEVSYGDDHWTRRLVERVRSVFETDCAVFPVFNGTAANALALAQLCRSFHAVICHESAHSQTDECGAPEFFSGGAKLIPTRGKNGKLELSNIRAALERHRDVHSPKPRVLSLTQSTELGTVYQPGEIEELSSIARENALFVHMDGARFANAVAALGCAPKAITWQAGVDVLCFGGTKNGTAAGELVIFFRKDLAFEFDYRAKQAGQLASKMRFLAAPWVGLLEGDAWLANARHANDRAKLLARKLSETLGRQPEFPVEGSAVFFRMPEPLVRALNDRGWRFYNFVEPDLYRLMCSWDTTEQDIDDFVSDLRNSLAGAGNGDKGIA